MENLKNKLFEQLKKIQGNGSFETSGIKKITLPGLRVCGVGEIGLPISPVQIKEIIPFAKKASFGKGSQTITDMTVRSAWEVDANQLSFHNDDWKKFLDKIVKEVKHGLGIEANEVIPSLYKLLIYEEGDFFLSHKDSEKEPGMFGTLILGLPSTHTGGELIIRFDGKETIIDFSSAGNYQIPYVAFFADCDHEIKPITSGYRVALVYNLLQSAGSQKINRSKTSAHVDEMAMLLESMTNTITDKPKAILLEHQYTPANFSLNSLKHHDRPRAELLLEAAQKANYFAALGLVTHYQMGDLEGGDFEYDYDYRSRYRRNHSTDLSKGTMGEIYDEYTTIDTWVTEDMPTLGDISIEAKDLLTNFEIGQGLPIEEDEEGFTGNAGMTKEYWYHYGAVILWPKSKHLELLNEVPTYVKLDWLVYYDQHWDHSEMNAIELSKQIITQLAVEAEDTDTDFGSTDFNIVATVLSKLDDAIFLDQCKNLLIAVFRNISPANWVALAECFEPQLQLFTSIFDQVGNKNEVYDTNHLLEVITCLRSNYSITFAEFLLRQVNRIPEYLEDSELSTLGGLPRDVADINVTRKQTTIAIFEKVIALSIYKEQDLDWIDRTVKVITKSKSRAYVNDVLIPALKNQKGVLADKIKQICIINLTERTILKPTPPPTWERNVPNKADSKWDADIWTILSPFLKSADIQVFEYKKAQAYRSAMETAIRNVTIDLEMETITTKGSPHILKLTKTQAAYQLALKKWKEDMAILEGVKCKLAVTS